MGWQHGKQKEKNPQNEKVPNNNDDRITAISFVSVPPGLVLVIVAHLVINVHNGIMETNDSIEN